MSRWLPLIALCSFSLGSNAFRGQAQSTGGISGIIKADDGKHITAVVRLFRLLPTQSKPVSVTTAADGTFTVSGLAAGGYDICPSVTGGGYLEPCLWDSFNPAAPVTAGKITQITVTVHKASTLKVHINDPGQTSVTPSFSKPGVGGSLVAGVFAPGGRFYPVVRTGGDANGSDHEVAVPFDKPFTFHLKPVGLSVVDATNTPVPSTGVSIQQVHSSTGATPPVLTFTVKGKS